MLINSIELYPLSWEYPRPIFDARSKIQKKNALLIKITSNEGTYGWGEAACFGGVADLVKYAIENHLFQLIEGKEVAPVCIKEFLYKATCHYGQKGIILSAISGIEIALWDLLGKKADMPIYEMLGATAIDVKMYASTGFYQDENHLSDLGKLEEDLDKINLSGFEGVKIKIGRYGIHDDVERISLAREKIGGEPVLIVDANNAYSTRDATSLSKRIDKFNIHFMEEAINFGDPMASKALKDKSDISIAGYELELGYDAHKDYITKNAVDYIQPDSIWSGGISECLNISNLAKRHSIELIPHNFSTIISLAANYQLLCAADNGHLLEYDHTGNPFLTQIAMNDFSIDCGLLKFNGKSGLCVDIDEEKITQFMDANND